MFPYSSRRICDTVAYRECGSASASASISSRMYRIFIRSHSAELFTGFCIGHHTLVTRDLHVLLSGLSVAPHSCVYPSCSRTLALEAVYWQPLSEHVSQRSLGWSSQCIRLQNTGRWEQMASLSWTATGEPRAERVCLFANDSGNFHGRLLGCLQRTLLRPCLTPSSWPYTPHSEQIHLGD